MELGNKVTPTNKNHELLVELLSEKTPAALCDLIDQCGIDSTAMLLGLLQSLRKTPQKKLNSILKNELAILKQSKELNARQQELPLRTHLIHQTNMV